LQGAHRYFLLVPPLPPLPPSNPYDQGFNHHAPVWWGNAFAILIEAAGLVILAVTYFYIWRNFDNWPPIGTLVPDLGVAMVNLVVLVVSVLPMWHVARLALRHDRPRVVGFWLLACVLFGIAAAILRVMEFKGVHTRWNANAYGAIVWSILLVHFAHIVAATLQTLALGIPMLRGPVDESHFAGVTANARYWYFVALSWVGLYAIVYLAPRVM
jgi:heme/copper-type cytochrome/quinol oxidase subunit 3